MQAIILCGGEGTRLCPLTSSRPKPLVRILGEPALKRLLRALSGSGIDEAVLCTRYLSQKIEDELGSECCGVRLRYSREDSPLGTAGCVRAAYDGVSEEVLILSGDGVTGFDYRDILSRHKSSKADVTIVAREVDDPREYGLMTVSDGVITGFIEKPGFDKCITNLANTGCYVVSGKVVMRIPEDTDVDFARDVFPELLQGGSRLCAYIDRSYWYDIGDIPSLLECQRGLLEMSGIRNLILPGAQVLSGSTVSMSVLEEGSALGGGSRVISSLIGKNSSVSGDADISEAVIGENCTVGSGIIMMKDSVLGDGCVVGSGVTLREGVRVAANTKIPDGAVVRTDIGSRTYGTLTFSENGVAEGLFDPGDLMRFGETCKRALRVGSVAMGGAGENFEPISLGIRSAGGDVFDLRGCSFGETVFCARRLGCEYMIYCDDDIRLLPVSTLELERSVERKIEQEYLRGENHGKGRGRIIPGAAESAVYISKIKKIYPDEPKIRAKLNTENLREAELFSEIITGGEGEEVVFTTASDHRTVSATTEEAVIPYENLVILAAKAELERGRSVTVLPDSPLVIEEICPDSEGAVCRQPSREKPLESWLCDPIDLIARVIKYLTETGKSLTLASRELPEIIYTRRIIEAPEGLPKLLSKGFEGTRAGRDITLESAGAKAYIRPLRTGKALKLYIESVSMEAAREIAEDVKKRLDRGQR